MTETDKQEMTLSSPEAPPEPRKHAKPMRGRNLRMHQALEHAMLRQTRILELSNELLSRIVELATQARMAQAVAFDALDAADDEPNK